MGTALKESFPWEIGDILATLPHRHPFALVDRVLSITEGPNAGNRLGRRIHALKCVTYNEPFFPGHFPQRPIMPGVLVVEAMAQASALLAARKPKPGERFDFLIAGVEKARFRQPVVPGDTLEFKCEIIRERSTIYGFRCEAFVRDQLVAEAEILALMVAVPE